MAVERMRTCESVDELARELGVTLRCLYKWRAKLEALELGEEAARPSTHAAAYRKENLRLKAAAGREDPGSGFFQRCLAKSRGSTPEERRNWRDERDLEQLNFFRTTRSISLHRRLKHTRNLVPWHGGHQVRDHFAVPRKPCDRQ
jgi:hypothetical protein